MLHCLPLLLLTAAALPLDQRPTQPGEWGRRPAQDEQLRVTPPGFCWRPQKEIVTWEIECGRGDGLATGQYRAEAIVYNVHCPPEVFPPGRYTWRYRGRDRKGRQTAWSEPWRFTVTEAARSLLMPARAELLGRIPREHPRLFLRPEDLPRLRRAAREEPLKAMYDELVAQCEKLMRKPPPTAEPPRYDESTPKRSETWRKRWWGNREYTIAALDGAATLAFTRRMGGKEEYGQLARRLLLECARWDPVGATGYRYNDEAGMPYASRFSRAYTFAHDLLSEDERRMCRAVMKTRGQEMFNHLCPRHLWQPYASHSNRAWHFLGEVGVAFLGEIEEADEWTWFAMNVFFNVYPVWCDDDGGWHEGASYWSSYIERFTWWADIMRAAMNIDAYRKPYFSQVGYYPMYLMPPGMIGGGFGDLCGTRKASDNVRLVTQLAAQAGNGHWQWYVETMGGPQVPGGYVGFLRGALPKVAPRAPGDLPSSRLFRGTGQACLNSKLTDARDSVQVNFKSSPFGTASHGYDANNSFLLWAYGKRLLVSSGWRDIYGSDHHRDWMWSTRSVNNITVDGRGQLAHSALAQGRIVAFATTPLLDAVAGEAGDAYRSTGASGDRFLDRYTRTILFVKPELVIVYDRLVAPRESTYQYWLHAAEQMEIHADNRIEIRAGDVRCDVAFLAPDRLNFRQTNEYDPNPRPRVTLREWHLTGETTAPAKRIEFVALYRPHRFDQQLPQAAELRKVAGGYTLTAQLSEGSVRALLPTDDRTTIRVDGLEARGAAAVERLSTQGKSLQKLRLDACTVQ